jgi:5'-3' exonuclease
MQVHLVDGTYELFRYFYAVPRHRVDGHEVGAARAVMRAVLGMLEGGSTHLGVATDHVIESFRNDAYPGYKTSAGIDPELHSQFPLLERALAALGVVVWPMVDYEADDALATAASCVAADERVTRVLIATPDKDLAQCVVGERIVQLDRRRELVRTEQDVIDRFGVPPQSIPDYLALVGDAADGIPGIKGWGAKSTAIVLARYGHIEAIPDAFDDWEVSVRGGSRLAETLAAQRDQALLYRGLTRLKRDVPILPGGVDELRWSGPGADLHAACAELDAKDVPDRLAKLISRPPQE